MSDTVELNQLQQWFLTAIISSGGPQTGVDAAQHRYGLMESRLLKPGHEQASRLPIYARAYVLRLQECLQADYPLLLELMGQELFGFFACQYIDQHPSRAPSLYTFGSGFADFLQNSQPLTDNTDYAFAIELARLERAFSEIIRAPGTEHLHNWNEQHHFASLMGGVTTCTLTPCTQLMISAFQMQEFWEAAKRRKNGDPLPDIPQAAPAFLALTRQHFRVRLLSLCDWQYRYLCALKDGGKRAPDIAMLAKQLQMPASDLLAEISLWQSQASALGLIYQIQ